MAKKVRWGLMAWVLILALGIGQPSSAQSVSQKYFPETGHWVTASFLSAYQAVPNPLLVYGYPITDAFQDQTRGLMVQYFQRARFELHPDAPADLRVQLTPLGTYLYTSSAPLRIPESFPVCQTFTETGFQVCYAFLDFFKANGGVAQFGYPISNFEFHDDRIVQYFQRSRFEWHPEALQVGGEGVVISDLGSQYFNVIGENPLRLGSPDGYAPETFILSLNVRAFTQKAVTALSGNQTVYVIVQDQNLRPVTSAQVIMIYRAPSGETGRYILPLTDTNGVTQYSFPFDAKERGIVQVWVLASYNNLQQRTTTSFRLWW